MIRIGQPISWTRLPLGGGAWLDYRPMTALDREAGRIAAQRAARAVAAGQAVLSEYDLPAAIAETKGDDPEKHEPKDPDLVMGAGALISLTEIALRCIRAWEGIGDAEGKPLPLSRPAMAQFLRDPFYYDLVDSLLSRGLSELDAEGNGSAPSANGAQAGAQATAESAPSSGSPAPTDAPAKTDSSALSA